MVNKQELANRLADYFATPDPGSEPPDPAQLGSPDDWNGFGLAVVALQHGVPPNKVYARLEAEHQQLLANADPDNRLPQPTLHTISATDLLATDWPEPTWAVPELLPTGLAVLAGRPKLGKSWLALQIALSVASGGHALGYDVEQGRVLYLALEDPPRRLADRMQKQGWEHADTQATNNADFMGLGDFQDQIGDLLQGGAEILRDQIRAKGYRLVVIDTLSRSIHGDQNDVSEMTAHLTPLQETAHTCNCALILIDHHKKRGIRDADVVDDVMGSTAKGAIADTIWGLYRKRGASTAKLAVTGRDVVAQTLELAFDGELGCWQSEGIEGELRITGRREELLNIARDLGRAQVKDFVEATGRNRSNVYHILQDLVSAGKLFREKEKGHVFYSLEPPL